MSLGSVLIGLQASRRDGRGVSAEEFLAPLNILPEEIEYTRANGGAWEAGMVCVAIVRIAHGKTAEDDLINAAAFEAALLEAFRRAGRFLARRSPTITEAMRGSGLSLRLFVDLRMDENQMDFELPCELLSACGLHGLSIYLITNDIPVSQILANRGES